MLKQETGILLLALGHPYYGRMAYNLAMSIKACDRATHITLVYNESAIAHINQRNMMVFDNKMQYPDTDQPFAVKLKLYELTPYDRTLYIDADTLWVNKQSPAILFDQLKGVPFTSITEGMHDFNEPEKSDHSKHYFFWADLEEIKKHYPVEKWVRPSDVASKIIYQWRSEFIYFEKSESVEDLFDLMQIIYREAQNFSTVKKFANHIPDELAINIATAMLYYPPHIYKWRPTFWDRLHLDGMPDIATLQSSYYVISCGSNASSGALKRTYDRICAASAYKLGLQHVFPLISKKEMLTNRQLM